MTQEKQSLPVRFIFKAKLNPGNPKHLFTVLQSSLKAKGLELKEDMTIEV